MTLENITEVYQHSLTHAKAEITDTTKTLLVTGVAGQRVKVWEIILSSSVAQLVYLYTGTEVMVPIHLGATAGPVFLKSADKNPLFATNAGASLFIEAQTSGNIYVYGHYTVE